MPLRSIYGRTTNWPPFARMRSKAYVVFRKLCRGEQGRGFQVWGTTGRNRHFALWTALRVAIPPDQVGRVLSFGCSTGEEAMDLADIFPRAEVLGVDVDRWRIKIAKRRFPGCRLKFAVAADGMMQACAPYDLIVAKSVFVRHPEAVGLDDLSRLFKFEDFDRAVLELTLLTSVGGHLVVFNSNYRVTDSSAMAHLKAIVVPGLRQPPEVPVFSATGKRAPDKPVWEIIFQRTAHANRGGSCVTQPPLDGWRAEG